MFASGVFRVRKFLLFTILGLAIFLVYLYYFVGFQDILKVFASVNLGEYALFYTLAIIASMTAICLRALSWKTLLGTLSIKISLRNAFLYFWTGYFVDLVLPVQSVGGEVTRLYLVQRETKKDYGAIAASGVTNGIIAYIIVATGLTAGTVYLLSQAAVPPFALSLLLLTWVGALIYLGVLLYLAFKENSAENLASFLLKILRSLRLKRFSQGLSPRTVSSLVRFQEGFKFFRARPRYVIKPAILQVIAFFLDLVVYLLVFYSMGFNQLALNFFIVVYFLAGAVQNAAGVFSVGVLDIVLTNIFIFFSISPAESGVAAALLRGVIFWFPLVGGYVVAHVVGFRKLFANRTDKAASES